MVNAEERYVLFHIFMSKTNTKLKCLNFRNVLLANIFHLQFLPQSMFFLWWQFSMTPRWIWHALIFPKYKVKETYHLTLALFRKIFRKTFNLPYRRHLFINLPVQRCWSRGGTFWQISQPYSNQGGGRQIIPTKLLLAPRIFRPSYGPVEC